MGSRQRRKSWWDFSLPRVPHAFLESELAVALWLCGSEPSSAKWLHSAYWYHAVPSGTNRIKSPLLHVAFLDHPSQEGGTIPSFMPQLNLSIALYCSEPLTLWTVSKSLHGRGHICYRVVSLWCAWEVTGTQGSLVADCWMREKTGQNSRDGPLMLCVFFLGKEVEILICSYLFHWESHSYTHTYVYPVWGTRFCAWMWTSVFMCVMCMYMCIFLCENVMNA